VSGERENDIRREVRALKKACREKRKKNAQQVPLSYIAGAG
jgi:hypothetical protein